MVGPLILLPFLGKCASASLYCPGAGHTATLVAVLVLWTGHCPRSHQEARVTVLPCAGTSEDLERFQHHLAFAHDRFEAGGIANDFANDVHGTGWHDLARLTYWRLPKKDAKGFPRRPVAQVTELDDFLGLGLQLGLYWNGKVDLITPGIKGGLDWQGCCYFLGSGRVVKLRLHSQIADTDVDAHSASCQGYPFSTSTSQWLVRV